MEVLGHYDPRQDPPVIKMDLGRAEEWIKKGAQPSQTVASLLARARKAAPAAPAAE